MRILVVTPSLGQSLFMDATVKSVERLRQVGMDVAHRVVCPRSVAGRLRERYRSIDVVPEDTAAGMYGAINLGLKDAGDWDGFTYINDDDMIAEGFVGALRQLVVRQHGEAILYGWVHSVGENGAFQYRLPVEPEVRRLLHDVRAGIDPIQQPGMLFSRQAMNRIGSFDSRLRLCGDFDLWLRAYMMGVKFINTGTHVADFRKTRNQLSGDAASMSRERRRVLAVHSLDEHFGLRRSLTRGRFRIMNVRSYTQRLSQWKP
jgi:hypothetical protein